MLRPLHLALAACLLMGLAACHPKPESASTAMTTTHTPAAPMKGSFFQRPFMNKIGRTDEAHQEAYFLHRGEEYFVKFCEGKVTRDEVRNLMDKPVEVQGDLRSGNLDICPGDPDHMQSRGGHYVAIQSIRITQEPLLTYADGNGNLYEANATSFRYVPVRPEESSSGMYSGGTYTVKEISPESFANLKAAFEQARTATADHTDLRTKGTGQLGWQDDKSEWTVILRMGSKSMQEMERHLKAAKGE